MNLSKLGEPFAPEDIEWRIQSSGFKNGNPWAKVLAYITNRAIQDRLDDVCGPPNWCNQYKEAPGGGILCGISIKCGDEWVTKWDGAEKTSVVDKSGKPDEDTNTKGGLSNSMKRAGAQWGVGRYLYKLEAGWANFANNGIYSDEILDKATGEKKRCKWNPPDLPKWALPKRDGNHEEDSAGEVPPQNLSELLEVCNREWGLSKAEVATKTEVPEYRLIDIKDWAKAYAKVKAEMEKPNTVPKGIDDVIRADWGRLGWSDEEATKHLKDFTGKESLGELAREDKQRYGIELSIMQTIKGGK